MPFPVFCAGPSAPLNLARHHAVESNVPIGCGGVAVYPGDLIVGDALDHDLAWYAAQELPFLLELL